MYSAGIQMYFVTPRWPGVRQRFGCGKVQHQATLRPLPLKQDLHTHVKLRVHTDKHNKQQTPHATRHLNLTVVVRQYTVPKVLNVLQQKCKEELPKVDDKTAGRQPPSRK